MGTSVHDLDLTSRLPAEASETSVDVGGAPRVDRIPDVTPRGEDRGTCEEFQLEAERLRDPFDHGQVWIDSVSLQLRDVRARYSDPFCDLLLRQVESDACLKASGSERASKRSDHVGM